MSNKLTRELRIFFNEHYDSCTLCNNAFQEGDSSHLGYLNDQTYALLCNDCSHNLKELVVRYYWMKREYETPLPADLLWRYMDLGKFISLIGKKELFFPAVKHFLDPFEGAKGIEERKEEWNEFYTFFFKNAIRTAPGINKKSLSKEKLESEAQRLLNEFHLNGHRSREHTFINCWHSSSYESEAMWRLYSKNIENAIAIQTTYDRLYNALDKEPNISFGKVKYIDFTKRFTSPNGAFWYKRKSFDYEKEVRLIAIDFKKKAQDGISFDINIDLLIEKIYVSPYAPPWFYDVVETVLRKFNIEKPLLYSHIKAKPFY